MKRFLQFSLIFTLSTAIIATVLLAGKAQFKNTAVMSAQTSGLNVQTNGAAPYKQWLFNLKKNPVTGIISADDVLNGIQQVRDQKAATASSRALDLDWESLGPNNIGGRTRAILIERDNPSTMFAGSVSGGLFVSDNGGLSWEPHEQNPTFESLLISSIAEAANGDIYFGTGESYISYYSGTGSFTHGFVGNGIYKSVDGGTTFQLLSSTEPTPGTLGSTSTAEWGYVNRIACHPTDANTIIAATSTGLRISTDGGTNWDYCKKGSTSLASRADDAQFGSDGILHASYVDQYYRSSDASNAQQLDNDLVGNNLPSGTEVDRMVIAVAPSDPNVVYTYAADNLGQLKGVYRSTDQGTNFTALTYGGSDFFNPPGDQGTWNLCIAVNPSDPGRIYIGGQVDAWSWSVNTGTWDQIAWSAFSSLSSKYIHADHHWIVFHPTNSDVMYYGTDGGIFRTQNANAQFPDFSQLNKGYVTTQLHGVAGGLHGEVLGGTQDNGSPYVNYSGNSLLEGNSVLGGDGGEAEISKIKPAFLFSSFFDFSGGGGALRRSVNEGNTFASFFDCNIDKAGGTSTSDCKPNGVADEGAQFVAADLLWEDYDKYHTFEAVLVGDSVEWPVGSGTWVKKDDVVVYDGQSITLDEAGITNAMFFYGTNSSIWVTVEPLKNSTEGAPDWFRLGNIGNVTAIATSADGDVVFAGTSAGQLWRFEGLLDANWSYIFGADSDQWFADSAGITMTNLTSNIGWSGGGSNYMTGLDVDQNDVDHVMISRGGYGVGDNVRNSTNAMSATPSFTSLSSSLPDIPVYDVMINSYDGDVVLVATEFGVWSYDIGSPGSGWSQETGLVGNVPVFEIRQEIMRSSECQPIYIGTHGRGFFRALNHVPEAIAMGCDFSLQATTGIEQPEQEQIIAGLSLYPNPATNYSNVTLQLNEAGSVEISVFDLSGRKVLDIGSEMMIAGSKTLQIDISNLSTGSYLVVARTASAVKSAKLMVSK